MRVIILGAASGIAEATARIYAAEGADLLLVGRQTERLEAIAADLKIRGATRVETAICDLADTSNAEVDFAQFVERFGGADHIILAYGTLGDQGRAERQVTLAEDILRVNFTSTAAWTLAAANTLERFGRGSLVVLGSVAGDRGRRANYIYGAAKAGLATLVQGLAHRFGSRGPRVVIVKPGPTITPMTASFDSRKGAMWAKPEAVAAIVRRAADQGGPVIYAPGRWWWIMLIIRNLPTFVFNRMNI